MTSFLIDKGMPGIAERTLIRPPSSRLGTITDPERAETMAASPLAGKYEELVDRDSAHERLAARAEAAAKEAEAADGEAAAAARDEEIDRMIKEFQKSRPADRRPAPASERRSRKREETLGEAVADVVIKELKGTTGRRIVRGILGGLFKGR